MVFVIKSVRYMLSVSAILDLDLLDLLFKKENYIAWRADSSRRWKSRTTFVVINRLDWHVTCQQG